MKPFTVRSGKFIGEHIIYDSPAEFNNATNLPYKRWGDISIKPDEWVVADDGYVIQCLHTTILTHKRTALRTYLYRFCNGTHYTYETKNYGLRILNFYINTDFTKCKSAIGKWHGKDKMFAICMESGKSLEESFVIAFKKKPTKFNLSKIIERNKDVIMNQIQNRLQTVNDQVMEATGLTIQEIIDEKLAQVAIVTHSQTNIKEIRENIKFLMWYAEVQKKAMKETNPEDDNKPPLME